ncbi:unnamed protein product [Brassicogethes aeneus]|uniref:UDP-glucuronosyltransferase n=1 Tax=Brassicogethes aeneus TaxID=1431903 RepID=A0A9P0FAF0_BRAAE|nr:unnamed protein product [Brassicogethes aeneus]
MKLLIFCSLVSLAVSANIFGYSVVPSPSHHNAIYNILNKLAEKGHNITYITPFPKNNTLMHEVDTSFTVEVYADLLRSLKMDHFVDLIWACFHIMDTLSESVIKMENVRTIFSQKFDVIIIENITPLTYSIGLVNEAPIITYSSLPGFLNTHDALGNPIHPVLSPNFILQSGRRPTFWHRLISTLHDPVFRLLYKYHNVPKCNKIVQKYFGDNLPSLTEVEKNISLGLFNRNFVFDEIRPSVPAAVDISSAHINPPKKLPKDIKDFMDSSKNGVVYFSFGTTALSYYLTKHKMPMIIESLSSLPYDVLFKHSEPMVVPKNFMVRDWLPQQDVLAHPNVKVFICQGGRQSLEEAVYNGVPILTLPIMGDQIQNAINLEDKELGLKLDIQTVSRETLTKTIVEVATNKKFRQNAIKMSKILRDHPMSGLETAVWWIEYVLRHKGTEHIKSGFIDMPFYQYYLLDVMGFILVAAICLFMISFTIFRFIRKNMCKRDKLKEQ